MHQVISRFIIRAITPKGRVHARYNQYIIQSSLSNCLLSAECVLSSHSMLSVFSNNNNAVNLSLNYLGKDIIGQTAALYAIHYFGKKIDQNPMYYIKYSIAMQQAALCLEWSTPFIPTMWFIPVASIAYTCKMVSFAGIGAVNIKVLQKISSPDNLGEVYSKTNVLNTLGSSVGMSVGLLLATAIPDHATRFLFFPILTTMRTWLYYRACKHII